MRSASLVASLVFLAASSTFGSIDIPFAYHDGMIWLNVSIPGRRAPLHFLLDSGAGQTVLDLGVALRLGLKTGCSQCVQGVRGCCPAFPVDEPGAATTVAGVPVPAAMLALDLSAVSIATGAHIDGLLGVDFFENRIVQIDFPAKKLRLLGPDEIPATGQVLPIARRNDAFCVRVAVNGNKPQWMRVDTGYNGALEWVVAAARSRRGDIPSIAVGSLPIDSARTEVTLGGAHFHGVTTGVHEERIFPGEDGLVGNGLLSRFRVTFDANSSRLMLTRSK